MSGDETARGAVAEAMVIVWALKEGFTVTTPVCGTQPEYDLCIDSGTMIRKIQVKRAYRRNGSRTDLRVELTDTNSNPYDCNKVDAFAIVDVDTGRIWLVPWAGVGGRSSLGLESGKHDKWLVQKGP